MTDHTRTIEALTLEIDRLRAALTKIAKPALGGKLQQQIAQEALSTITTGEDNDRT